MVPDGARGLLVGLRFARGRRAHRDPRGRRALRADVGLPLGRDDALQSRSTAGRVAFAGRGPASSPSRSAGTRAVAPRQAPAVPRRRPGVPRPAGSAGALRRRPARARPPAALRRHRLRQGRRRAAALRAHRPGRRQSTFWLGVAGSRVAARPAPARARRLLADPAAALARRSAPRAAARRPHAAPAARRPAPARGIDWSKQNLADSVQEARDLQMRVVERGQGLPAAPGTFRRVRFLGAGWPDYPWLFATDGEYTAFASVALGQFEPITDHLRALRDISGRQRLERQGRPRGRVRTARCTSAPRTTQATPTRPRSSRARSRCSGAGPATAACCASSTASRARHRATSWRSSTPTATAGPRALGNVEREGMGEEKLDNAVYPSAACATWPTWRARRATGRRRAGRRAGRRT